MGIIRILFTLLNNPRVIDKLAESRIIRRAAQITAYALTKAKIAGRDTSERFLGSRDPGDTEEPRRHGGTPKEPRRNHGDMDHLGARFRRLRETFVKELKEGWRDASRQAKK
ncbi:hypothetical protein NHX12_033803 [Muraenolepis orangiensis]|uniref:Uncharacterized protein n=1 Tax=Muraenolepis orangiensis TaxID=630683 RepID=A0A9Q0E4E7_9TELE|nr:hypothetical protein NHX12_033803 [Muraenolepis orangiensis]